MRRVMDHRATSRFDIARALADGLCCCVGAIPLSSHAVSCSNTLCMRGCNSPRWSLTGSVYSPLRRQCGTCPVCTASDVTTPRPNQCHQHLAHRGDLACSLAHL